MAVEQGDRRRCGVLRGAVRSLPADVRCHLSAAVQSSLRPVPWLSSRCRLCGAGGRRGAAGVPSLPRHLSAVRAGGVEQQGSRRRGLDGWALAGVARWTTSCCCTGGTTVTVACASLSWAPPSRFGRFGELGRPTSVWSVDDVPRMDNVPWRHLIYVLFSGRDEG